MDDLFLAITRSTGIVATLLLVAALAWGFFFSSRTTGTRLRPAWWLDLHNWLGGAALAFTAAHITASLLDPSSGIGLAQALVPGTAENAWGIGWGVVAAYLVALAVLTTWPRRLANRRWWRIIHLGAVAALGLALVHTYLSGSDSGALIFRVGLVLTSGLAMYALGIRLFSRLASAFPGTRDTAKADATHRDSPATPVEMGP